MKIWEENYGADADGNRGVMTTMWEFEGTDIENREIAEILFDKGVSSDQEGMVEIEYEGITDEVDVDSYQEYIFELEEQEDEADEVEEVKKLNEAYLVAAKVLQNTKEKYPDDQDKIAQAQSENNEKRTAYNKARVEALRKIIKRNEAAWRKDKKLYNLERDVRFFENRIETFEGILDREARTPEPDAEKITKTMKRLEKTKEVLKKYEDRLEEYKESKQNNASKPLGK